jgi:hypothetical protein
MSVSSSFMNSTYLRDICWKVDRDGTPFHDCFTDNTMLLVGLLAGLILFHEFEATLQVTTDSYWFFFPPPPLMVVGLWLMNTSVR